MKFFVDFEATQPENEIIAIGISAENGSSFYSLVKPQLNSISKFVSDLTHISQEDLDKANFIDEVMSQVYTYMIRQEPRIVNWEVFAYGDDSGFIKSTLPVIKTDDAYIISSILISKIQNCEKTVHHFFRGTISLIRAYNYVKSLENEQRHNPLEDAQMLQEIMNALPNIERPAPRAAAGSPFVQAPYNPPIGKFTCKTCGKKSKVYEFDSCEEAIDWFIENQIAKEDQDRVHRDRIMRNIMKSVRSKKPYANFKWSRVKEEEKND